MSQDTLPSSWREGRWTLILVGFREEAVLALPVLPFPAGRCGPVRRPRRRRAGAPELPRARLAPGPGPACVRGREWLCRAWRLAVGRRSPGARISPAPKVCRNSKACTGCRGAALRTRCLCWDERVRARPGRGRGAAQRSAHRSRASSPGPPAAGSRFARAQRSESPRWDYPASLTPGGGCCSRLSLLGLSQSTWFLTEPVSQESTCPSALHLPPTVNPRAGKHSTAGTPQTRQDLPGTAPRGARVTRVRHTECVSPG